MMVVVEIGVIVKCWSKGGKVRANVSNDSNHMVRLRDITEEIDMEG